MVADGAFYSSEQAQGDRRRVCGWRKAEGKLVLVVLVFVHCLGHYAATRLKVKAMGRPLWQPEDRSHILQNASRLQARPHIRPLHSLNNSPQFPHTSLTVPWHIHTVKQRSIKATVTLNAIQRSAWLLRVAGCASFAAADWPRFRGPDGSGIAGADARPASS
jgi:hypothetical protein